MAPNTRSVSNAYGGVQAISIHNATHGFLADLGECVAQKLGIYTNEEAKTILEMERRG